MNCSLSRQRWASSSLVVPAIFSLTATPEEKVWVCLGPISQIQRAVQLVPVRGQLGIKPDGGIWSELT